MEDGHHLKENFETGMRSMEKSPFMEGERLEKL